GVSGGLGYVYKSPALQMVMLKNGVRKDTPPMTGWLQVAVFIFGVFELLVWMMKFKAQVKK
ncbi:DUF1145 family protein, partial [Enterobacter intestinihominis]